jgi:hypothetical protein
LRIQGGKPTVNLDDSGDTGNRTIAMASDGVNGYLLTGLLPPSSVGRGRVWLQLDPAAPVSLLGGPASDLFQVNNLTGAPALSLVGNTQGTTTLQGPNTANTWQVTGANAGTLDGTVAFSGVQNLIGGSAGNTFQFHTGGSLAGTLNGGGGTNTLDYSAYKGDILVDLLLHTASLVGQGVSNIANVTGSQGNNLLVGDANPNVLIGGTGRNVLIGGAGADTLDASGSSGDNILIGGTTNFDNNLAALQAIFAEWTRTDLSFRDRFSDLSTGTNGQGATPLNKVNGQLILLTSSTVHADSSPDTLIGSNLIDPATGKRVHNWFFFDADDTLVNFLSSSDHKTKVK